MAKILFLTGLLTAGAAASLTAQVGAIPATKRAFATRLDGEAIHIDGKLDELQWRNARYVTDFKTREPIENGAPTDDTEVAFLFDDRALYVGARLRSKDPAGIPRNLTRRDQYGNSEHITISLDPFLDRRTAYSFSVTSAGVRRDYYHPNDNEGGGGGGGRDFTFDPVWDAKVSLDSTGWTAEIRIPFSQLRFNDRPVQEWGLNVNRWVPERNEDVFWVVVPRNETGFVSRFGTLDGIQGIKPSRRIELAPYFASSGTFAGSPDPQNALNPDGRTITSRAGADLKMGLGPGLTIDATINPDFGQVEADPAEVNLTAFETFFDERRPFFTEGSRLLQGGGSNYFYSRRIGGRPRGSAAGDYVSAPSNTTIISAAKLTGRLSQNLSIGALAAVTDREFAKTYDSLPDAFGRTLVEPRAQFGVVRLEQQFGADASTVGAIVSGMNRSFGGDSLLPEVMTHRAVAGGADWTLRFARGRYVLSGGLGASRVEGSQAAILALQEAPQRYLQRPDFHAVALDSAATSLQGYRARLRADKNAGNWLWGAEVAVESPTFESNDMGRVQSADDIDWNADINHRWTVPGRVFRSATIGVITRGNMNFDGVRTRTGFSMFSRATWRNFYNTSLNLNCNIRGMSDDLTRGGPLMATPAGCEVNTSLSNNFADATSWRVQFNTFRSEGGDWQFRLSGGVTVRPSSAVSISFNPNYSQNRDSRQYLTTLDNGPAATFGRRYVFGSIRRSTLVAQTRINYTFSPNLTLEAYAEPFAASGKYTDIGELEAARTRDLRTYGTEGTTISNHTGDAFDVTDSRNGETFSVPVPDFNVLSFRSNMVLRWEWRPGSTLFFVWQQSRRTTCVPGDPSACPGSRAPGSLVGPASLADALGSTGDNFLAVKLSYWLPIS
ncbi:MAG: DUF5916 domain-containing protein [Gemmatimonadales bacterium]